MSRKQLLAYFQATEKSSSVNNDDVKVTKYVKSAIDHASNAELNLTGIEILKSCQKKQEYQRSIPKRSKNTRETFQKEARIPEKHSKKRQKRSR